MLRSDFNLHLQGICATSYQFYSSFVHFFFQFFVFCQYFCRFFPFTCRFLLNPLSLSPKFCPTPNFEVWFRFTFVEFFRFTRRVYLFKSTFSTRFIRQKVGHFQRFFFAFFQSTRSRRLSRFWFVTCRTRINRFSISVDWSWLDGLKAWVKYHLQE